MEHHDIPAPDLPLPELFRTGDNRMVRLPEYLQHLELCAGLLERPPHSSPAQAAFVRGVAARLAERGGRHA